MRRSTFSGFTLTLFLVVVVAAVLGPHLPGLPFVPSARLGDAPGALLDLAAQAGEATDVDPNVLLAIAKVECSFGQCRTDQPDALVPADIRAHVDVAALQPGGRTARLLGLAGGRRIGDWVNPEPVAGGQHAMGFMQFLPSTWRLEAPLAPGGPSDPYDPFQAMVVAGSYLHRLESGAETGRPESLSDAIATYGGSQAYAAQVLALAQLPAADLDARSAALGYGRVLQVTDQTPVMNDVPPGGWPHATYPYGQCTWWVAYNRPVPPYLGDAWQWLDNAARAGYQVSSQPVVGSIVVYARNHGYST
ncbi:MAG TPA: CHAP domain-containing protein, partial [Candidatus Dormibacteraeota bacterium]|nr:CHAP domain-containing protein [Candidatus Dormibacteraeota bacterium]